MSLRSLLLAGTVLPIAVSGIAAPLPSGPIQLAQAQPAAREQGGRDQDDRDRRRGEERREGDRGQGDRGQGDRGDGNRRDGDRPPPPERERSQSAPAQTPERRPETRPERPTARPAERPTADRDDRPAREPERTRAGESPRATPERPAATPPVKPPPAQEPPAARERAGDGRPAGDRPRGQGAEDRNRRDDRSRGEEAPRRPPSLPDRAQDRESPADRRGAADGRPEDRQPDNRAAPPRRPPAPPTVAAPSPASPPAATADELRARRMDDIRGTRREVREGDRTVIRESGRTMIREGNRTIVRHNELDRFRAGARDVTVRQRGRETVSTVVRPGGARIVTVVDADGRLIRRSRLDRRGKEVVLIDNRRAFAPNRARYLDLPPPVVRIPRDRYVVPAAAASAALLYETLTAAPVERIERPYALDEIRYTAPLRDRMPRIDLDTITFETGSWAIPPEEAGRLEAIAEAMRRAIRANTAEIFLIEGHTDAVGSDIDNLSLSDRRAEAVAIALSERYQVPAENLTTQGYGEEFLKIATDGSERENRRVAVRRITPLLTGRGGPPRG